jgi:hypothetical protein
MQLVVIFVSKKSAYSSCEANEEVIPSEFTVDNLDGLQSSLIALIMQLVVLFVSQKSAYSSCEAK